MTKKTVNVVVSNPKFSFGLQLFWNTTTRTVKNNNLVSCFSNLYITTLLLLLQLICSCAALSSSSHSTVEFLPGFHGPLPFHLQTGYVGVGESEDVQLFYYFVGSESNPREDPLMLWLTGGPGCSSFTALAFEFGPIMFEMVEYNGSLPTLILNPDSWTKTASIIFLDLPVGTGFSYGRTDRASQSTHLQACEQAFEFMRKWLISHPEFISNPFYVGGDSFSGLTVPIITQLISNGNEAFVEPFINLKGYVAGNPVTFPEERNYEIPFAHGMGLIPDDLYEPLQGYCKGEYRSEYMDPNNVQCMHYYKAYEKCESGLNIEHILEPNCGLGSLRLPQLLGGRRALDERFISLNSLKQPFCGLNSVPVRHRLSNYWMNDASVLEALHVRKGTTRRWQRCRSLNFTEPIMESRPYHASLSKKGYRSLIYSGDHDMLVPHQSTQAWIGNLDYSIVSDWRPWKINGQIAGYTRSYSNQMTFATVKGAGHTAPEYRPEECCAMFKRWIAHEPL